MADMPSSKSRVDERVGSVLKVRSENLTDEIRSTHSRSQEGRGSKLGHSVNANPSNSNKKRSWSHVLSSVRLTLMISLRSDLSKL